MVAAERLAAASPDEIVDVSTHLQFVEALLKEHSFDRKKRKAWTAVLEKIRSRQADTDLYLAVVGEFSSGKSTLVNALIRQDILLADVLPATTAAATLLRYGPHSKLRVDYTDGRHEEISEGEGPARGRSLGELVRRFTAEEEVACTVSRVTVFYPATVLQQGLVAVDMPGTNVENHRHVELAGWAIRELCDAAIVAIPANFPVSESLADFLREHLRDALHRCVFVVTMIDLVRPSERTKLLATVASRLSAKLGIASPLVLPASAAAVLNTPLPDGTDAQTSGAAGEAYRALQAQFLETEARISQALQQQRSLILLERASSLVSNVLDGLKEELEIMERRYQEEHAALETHRISDLKPFIDESKTFHGKSLVERINPLIGEARKAVVESSEAVLKKIEQALNGAGDKDALQKVIKVKVEELLTEEQKELETNLLKIWRKIGKAARREIDVFETEFHALYRSLQTLGGRIDLDHAGKEALPGALQAGLSSGAGQALAQFQKQQEDDSGRSGAMVFIAVLTGIALPGPALLYGLGAWIVSRFFAPSLDEVRRECKQKLRAETEKSFSEAEAKIVKRLTEERRNLQGQLDRIIDNYFEHYNALVQEMVSQDQKRARELAGLRRRVRGDLRALDERRQNLQQARAGLQKIHKL